MNKRHYEHTLPNIRGSLSNTYFDAKVKAKPRNVFAARLNLFCQEVHYLFS